jgi:hypothetical protein
MKNNKHLLNRTDLSNFIVHLTKDTLDDKKTAKENLINILNSMKIEARNFHCLFNKFLSQESKNIQEKFYVSCFTETPISKLKDFFEIENRRKNFKPYGVIFLKDIPNSYALNIPDYKVEHPNPVLYVTQLNKTLINALKTQYNHWLEQYKNHGQDSKFYLLGALVNFVGEKNDFSWEREWRVVGNYEFIPPDIVAVIAPEEEHDVIRREINNFSAEALTLIDANWTIEEMLVKVGSFAWNNWYKYHETLEELSQLKKDLN